MDIYEICEIKNSKHYYFFRSFKTWKEATDWVNTREEMNRDQYRTYGLSVAKIGKDGSGWVELDKFGWIKI